MIKLSLSLHLRLHGLQVVALLLMALRLGKQRGVLSETTCLPRILHSGT